MKVLILTSSLNSTASHHLPYLLKSNIIEVVGVIYAKGHIQNKKRHYLRKIKKIWKIGILGTINGILIRKWYGENLKVIVEIKNLKQLCESYKIPFCETLAISTDATRNCMKQYQADLGISLGNSYIPPSVFSIPRLGMINIHHEVLPDYPNAQSVIWQLYNGSSETGYSIHKVSKQIDAGLILHVEKTPILFRRTLQETVTETLAKVMELSAKGLVDTLENFEKLSKEATTQVHNKFYTTPSFIQFMKMKRNWKNLKSFH
jgi:methionyl-tRNA formyltransferase